MRGSMFVFGALAAVAMARPAAATPEADYTQYCVSCHGKDGKGKTKMGEKFGIKDFTDAKVQAEFTDEKALQNIADGVNDPATGKTKMPARKDKLSQDQMKDLVKYVRAFKTGG